MRRLVLPAILSWALSVTAIGAAIYRIELRGDAEVFALDRPVRKGRVLLFHRFPDGVFTSVPAEEVVRVGEASAPAGEKGLRPGETIVLGPTGEGRAEEASTEERAAAGAAYRPPGGGAYSNGTFGYGPVLPLRVRPTPRIHAAPPLVAPNGFPAPPGYVPPVIGPNGFPILAPFPKRSS